MKSVCCLVLGSALISANIAIGDMQGDQTYACVATLETVHQDGGPSFQHQLKPAISAFVLKIGKAPTRDVVCAGIKPGTFFAALCKFPLRATAQHLSYYGQNEADAETFRGLMPWDYFVLYHDQHFLWSVPVDKGVSIRSGTCTAN
ncbi:MAG TPA: hypothetical protein VGM17_01465 [Rhizomicrobium sp.]